MACTPFTGGSDSLPLPRNRFHIILILYSYYRHYDNHQFLGDLKVLTIVWNNVNIFCDFRKLAPDLLQVQQLWEVG